MEKEEYERIIRDSEKKIQKLLKKVEQLQLELNKAERRLLAYENAHTPPSKQRFTKNSKKISSGKIGAKKGHPRYTRPEPIPDRIIEYDQIDEKYQDKELALLAQKVHYEEEIPEPQQVFVTKHIINIYLDINTGEVITAKNSAPKGSFGKNAETHITLLKFADRLPLRKVEESLQRQHNLRISNVGIYGVVRRVSQKLQVPYYEIMKTIRSSGVLYIDETQFKVNGKSWWLWVFVSENATLFVLRDSRGEEVIEEILGKEYTGKISADGWKVYGSFAKILQRCWAHLLRESEQLMKKYQRYKPVHEKIKAIFNQICEIRNKPPPLEKRIKLRKELEIKLQNIARSMKYNPRYRELGTKINNGMEAWFTCVEHLDIQPTNNYAEQALREPIIQRKIMGGLRSKDGTAILECICSCIATWKKQEKPLFATLREHL